MRFKLILEVNKKAFGNLLPLNYQYEQSAAIYKILFSANEEYATWLHNNGYEAEPNTTFKLFTYSRFKIEKRKILPEEERLKILCDTIEWQISFLPEKSTEEFIKGVFLNQTFEIGDKQSCVQFLIKQIEILPPPNYKKKMQFNTMSPLCIRFRENAKRYDQYLSPADDLAEELILQNILSKYKAIHNKEYTGNLENWDFKILNAPKSVLIKIKSGTKEESKVRGYMCKFRIEAPIELIKIVYEGGLGSLNSQGFGCLEVL